MVSALDVRSEGRWFDAQSLPSCCFIRQDTLPHIFSLHSGVQGIPGQASRPGGSSSTLSCYGIRDKLWPCGPPWRDCHFLFFFLIRDVCHIVT